MGSRVIADGVSRRSGSPSRPSSPKQNAALEVGSGSAAASSVAERQTAFGQACSVRPLTEGVAAAAKSRRSEHAAACPEKEVEQRRPKVTEAG